MILQNVFAYNVEFGSHFPDGVTKHYKLGLHEGQQMMGNADMDHGYLVLKSYSTFLSRNLDGLDVRGGDVLLSEFLGREL